MQAVEETVKAAMSVARNVAEDLFSLLAGVAREEALDIGAVIDKAVMLNLLIGRKEIEPVLKKTILVHDRYYSLADVVAYLSAWLLVTKHKTAFKNAVKASMISPEVVEKIARKTGMTPSAVVEKLTESLDPLIEREIENIKTALKNNGLQAIPVLEKGLLPPSEPGGKYRVLSPAVAYLLRLVPVTATSLIVASIRYADKISGKIEALVNKSEEIAREILAKMRCAAPKTGGSGGVDEILNMYSAAVMDEMEATINAVTTARALGLYMLSTPSKKKIIKEAKDMLSKTIKSAGLGVGGSESMFARIINALQKVDANPIRMWAMLRRGESPKEVLSTVYSVYRDRVLEWKKIIRNDVCGTGKYSDVDISVAARLLASAEMMFAVKVLDGYAKIEEIVEKIERGGELYGELKEHVLRLLNLYSERYSDKAMHASCPRELVELLMLPHEVVAEKMAEHGARLVRDRLEKNTETGQEKEHGQLALA